MTTLSPGGRAHTCSLKDCSLDHCGGSLGCLAMKAHDCQQNRDDRAQQTEHMPGNEGFLHM